MSPRPVHPNVKDLGPDGRVKPSARPPRPAAPGSGLVQLAGVQAERVQWLWKGRIPLKKLTLLDGDPGVAKSTICVDFAARVTTGRPWPDGEDCPKGNALILTAEDGVADTVLPRVLAAGGDPSRIMVLPHIMTELGERAPAFPADTDLVGDICKKHGVKLVVIDVLTAFLDSSVNGNRDGDMRRVLARLSRMAEKAGPAVIGIRHLNKNAQLGNAMYRGGGSIGITGHARAVHLAALDPEDPMRERRIFAPVKINIAVMPRPLAYSLSTDETHDCARVNWLGEATATASALLAEPVGDEARDDQDEAAAWLIDYLSNAKDRSASYAEIWQHARKHQISERTLKRCRVRAGVSYRRAGWQQGTVWYLAEPLPFDAADAAP